MPLGLNQVAFVPPLIPPLIRKICIWLKRSQNEGKKKTLENPGFSEHQESERKVYLVYGTEG